jgi:hypothetical protein
VLFSWPLMLLDTELECGEETANADDERYPGPLLGVNGVMGEAGAFINRPPHRLQFDEPDGL